MSDDQRQEEIRREIGELISEFHGLRFGKKEFVPGMTKVDPSGKNVGIRDLQYGVNAVLDGWWTEGRYAEMLKDRLKKRIGTRHALLTNSGSSSNLLAIYALTSNDLERRINPGDEVISCATSFPTTINPIFQAGAVPVFIDANPIESGLYNPECSRLEDALSPKTKAIIFAHTLGNPFDLDMVMDFAKKNGLYVIEDCCDALGSTWNGKSVGSFGDMSTLSMYPAHHITAGEGGAVFMNEGRLFRSANSFRNWGRHCWCEPGQDNSCGKRYGWKIGDLPKGYDHKNTYYNLGFNLKMTDMQAAIAVGQSELLDEFIAKRKANFEFLNSRLSRYQDKLILPKKLPNADPSWFGYLISVREDSGIAKLDLVNYLAKKNIMTRDLFGGNMTRQPSLKGQNYRVVGDLSNSDAIMERTFWIGVQPNLSPEALDYVAETFDKFFSEKYSS